MRLSAADGRPLWLGYGMNVQATAKYSVFYLTGSPQSACKYVNAQIDALAPKLAAADQLTPSQDAIDLWQDITEVAYGDVLALDILFIPLQAALSNRVGGAEMQPIVATGAPEPDLIHSYIKK